MGKIPHTYRRPGGTYALRKRIHFPKAKPAHITWSLGTKDPSLARIRAAAACAALDWAVAIVGYHITLNGGARSATETSKLVRAALDLKLGFTLRDHVLGPDSDAEAANLMFGDYYDLASRYDGRPVLDTAEGERLRGQGRTEAHIAALRRLIQHGDRYHVLSDRHLQLQLETMGFAYDPYTAAADRHAVLTGWREAQYRARHFHDGVVQASGDPAR